MKLLNLRYGFATNSSSTHSFVILNDQHLPAQDNDVEEGRFGWDFFTAASKKAKTEYMAVQLYDNVLSYLPEKQAREIVKAYTGVDIGDKYIDHQSTILLPQMWPERYTGKSFVCMDFFKDLMDFVLQDKVVVLGGNDNDEDFHPLMGRRVLSFFQSDVGRNDIKPIAVKDDNGFWTLFSPENGNKLRVSFDTGEKAVEGKASRPELIDLKVTDFCDRECKYCYQNSTPEGMHGDKKFIREIIRALVDLKTFEVAIGGGEPTKHPHFFDILQTAKYSNVVANFSTRNIEWLDHREKRDYILNRIGAFAYSVDGKAEIDKLANKLDYYGIPKNKVVIQLVPATFRKYDLEKALEACNYHGLSVTLLGYKTCGRGTDYMDEHDGYRKENIECDGDFLSAVKKLSDQGKCPKLGIDTCLAEKYEEKLKELGIPSYLYYTKEGTFSMYIDAVNKKMGPSSFCKEEELVDIVDFNYLHKETRLENQIVKAFRSFSIDKEEIEI